MKKGVSLRIRAPFVTPLERLGFLFLLSFFLTLPILLSFFPQYRASRLFASVPLTTGPFHYLSQQFEKGRPDVDILIVCSSLGWTGLLPTVLQEDLSRELGRKISVQMLGTNWRSQDMLHYLVKNFLDVRRAKLVLMEAAQENSAVPHETSRFWLQFWPHLSDFVDLPALVVASYYAEGMIGSLHQLVAVLRPNDALGVRHMNYPDTEESTKLLGGRNDREGYSPRDTTEPATRYEEFSFPVASFGADELFFDGHSPHAVFQYSTERSYLPHEEKFLSKTVQFAREKGAQVGLLHFSFEWAWQNKKIEVFPYRNSNLREEPPVVFGASPAKFFSGLDKQSVRKLYYNDRHMNYNGSRLYTKVLVPGIAKYWREHIENGS